MVQIARRKKGRPSKADLARRSGESQSDPRRSLRRRSVRYNIIDYDGDYLDDDEEDERRREKKKLKLMAKLNQDGGEEEEEEEREEEEENETATNHTRAESREEHAPVEEYDDEKEQEEENENEQEEENEEDEDSVVKGRKVESKGLHSVSVSVSGAPVILQSGIPLPDKRTLELILDKLQKKDTYGVFADPVDLEELPDYLDVIEHPMDFATVRKKLGNGSYTTLEQFESDVFLICSNAMQYNAPETIYHKQARSIQELGRKKFEKLRIGFERSQIELKSEEKAGSNYLVKKQPKKPLARASQEPVGSDFSSGATLATIADVQPTSHLMQGGSRCERSGNIDGILEANAFWIDANQERADDVLSGKGLLSKWGRKSSVLDESRRASYNMSNQPIVRSDSIFMTFESKMKHLVTVGLDAEYSYARSLARFGASLGPIAWKIASHRIQNALPAGCKFGRGWVGEYEPLPTPILMVNNRVQKETSLDMKLHSTTELPKGNQNCKNVESSIEHPVNGQMLEGKHPSMPDFEGKPFFGSAGVRLSAPFNIRNQEQNAQSRMLGKSEKNGLKQVELNSLPSSNQNNNGLVAKFTSHAPAANSLAAESKPREMVPRNMFKQPDTNGVVGGESANGKVRNTSLNRQVTGSSPESTLHQSSRAAPAVVHGQEQGLGDPVQLMRMFAERAQKQHTSSNHLLVDIPPVTLSGPSGQRNDSGNASAAAAHAWMSVGAGGFKQGPGNSSSPKNQISADSLYNSTRELHQHISRIRGEFPSGGMPFQPFQAVAPQPIHTGAVSQFPNRPMVFPQLASADQSRFQMQSPWRGISPHSQSRQKQETLPPDLNIDFESPGSPVKQSSGVLVDSQQPDLALQL
ncbi:uncharacterized protein LOC114394457 isoform X2 [Glycine soja]|uniref:uncharacterized protein LOC114394457 isoform X2 n=1 Tax=Glycine soja TaxID=3848 RepID=UPI00103ED38D|nr:uncharacterized protein LOC114394457 isoform X2 [Glycine soja]